MPAPGARSKSGPKPSDLAADFAPGGTGSRLDVELRSPRNSLSGRAGAAANFDVKWVMSQVGAADSKMTLDVYAQREQRVQRNHGAGSDRLVRQAQLGDSADDPLTAAAA